MNSISKNFIAGPAVPEPSGTSVEFVLAGLDSLNQGITIFDAELRLVATNRLFLEMRDIPEHLGRMGTPFEDQVRFRAQRGDYGPGDAEDYVVEHMETARKFEPHLIERLLSDGSVLEIHGMPLQGGGFIATYTDITERKRAQEELQLKDEKLEQQNAELEDSKNHFEKLAAEMATMAEDLALARQEAEEVSRAKSEFLTAMSHELRTPLNAVIGFAQLMRDETLGSLGNDSYRIYAESIYGSGQNLLDLINDILDLSEVQSGRDQVHDETIVVPELVAAVMALVGNRPRAQGVGILTEVTDDLPLLRADPRKLKQVLVNLMANAIKFTESGGRVTLKMWCRPNSGFVFQVADTGIGMKLDDIPKALSLFGQVDGRLSRKYQGTGLGLPLSKSLVELHSGSLDLQSEIDVGTTVTIRLPAERIVRDAGNTMSGEQAS